MRFDDTRHLWLARTDPQAQNLEYRECLVVVETTRLIRPAQITIGSIKKNRRLTDAPNLSERFALEKGATED